uniref:Cytochrome b n=1 Tax=Theileria taurotragi TaxID=27993 RepID=A0A7T6YA78_THETA|nr:cytochrome b [Theileria taurotragi]QQK56383.1 cytochrome b [Theileria taurotragi]
MNLLNAHLLSYLVPKNLNLNWNFGFILGILLVFQIVSGLLLTFFYIPCKDGAFDSVAMVMTETNFGWCIRLYHSIGVSFYFFFMFLHIIKGMWYSSKYLPWSWYSGMIILVLSIAIAFIGYVLPDGQMSFWGATVIANLLKWLGRTSVLIFGGFTIGPETIQRFFILHFVLPFVVLFIVVLHLYFLHREGSTNPLSFVDAVSVLRFYPLAIFSDIRFIVIVIALIGVQVGYGVISIFQADPDNSILSDPLTTPAHIIPEWYLLLFYATLKVFPTKVSGLLAMAAMLELLILLVEARSKAQTVSTVHYHRVWTTASVPLVPALFMLGCIGKMVINFDLIVIGICIVLLTVIFVYKLLDSSRICV